MLIDRIHAARGAVKADLVLKNGNIINVFTEEIEQGDVAICDGVIIGIGSYGGWEEIDCSGKYIAPGFIDGHIHLESSMMKPVEFARTVLPMGTTTVITDPHEIANVCGIKGIDYMLRATEGLPLEVYFTLPSCVPSSEFDENGAILKAKDLVKFYSDKRIVGLAEIMNYVGTIHGDYELLDKINDAVSNGRVIDGHAPGLSGNDLSAYIAAGVQSDHECSNVEEAMEKIKRGQWVMIREGTAAKNLNDLMPIFDAPYYQRALLVTDDKHPSDLFLDGHINFMVKKAVVQGANPCVAIKMASFNAANYFGLKGVGAIAPNYKADLIILSDLNEFPVEAVYKSGKLVASCNNVMRFDEPKVTQELQEQVMHSFHLKELVEDDFHIKVSEEHLPGKIRVIGLVPGQIITEELTFDYHPYNNGINIAEDILKLAVIERHQNTGHIGLSYMKGYGLKHGAIASSISHDSHNLIVAGTNEADMSLASNCVRNMQGGIAIVRDGAVLDCLPLPIAGLMSELNGKSISEKMDQLKALARQLGVSERIDPFMTLAFVSLPVIPTLKLSTLGLIDVVRQVKVETMINT